MLGIDMNEATRPVKMRSSSRGNSKSATKRKKSSGKAEWKPKVPPILNCAPSGWKPNFVTSNFLLCPANFDYWVADAIVPPLYAIGVDTPNKITCLNCVLRAFIIWLLLTYQYLWVTILLPWTQFLDCADGQCARRYGLGSEYGAWLDHFTDEIFGYAFAFVSFYLIHVEIGCQSIHFVSLVVILAIMGVGGKATFDAKENGRKYKDYKFTHLLGMYEEYYMTYIYIFLMVTYVEAGAFPGGGWGL